MSSNGQPEDVFFESLRKALNHFDDPVWIGKRSPLATPYFLGDHLQTAEHGDDPAVRGRIFQTLIHQTFHELWGDDLPTTQRQFTKMVDAERLLEDNQGARYACYLLDMRYLRHYFNKNRPDKRMQSIAEYVSVSESSLYVHLQAARQQLGRLFLKRIQPIFRPEHPPLPEKFIGRDETVETIIDTLRSGRSVTVSGMGGMGKTSLGAAVMRRWNAQSDPVFWFTVRPDLNDHVNSFLFALSNFLFHQGQKRLWNYLRAQVSHFEEHEQNAADYTINQVALELLRSDLAALPPNSVLLCIDEADRLFSAEQNVNHYAHLGLIELIDGLQSELPLLIIGQKPTIDTAEHIRLNGLPFTETAALLKQTKLKLPPDAITTIHEHTQGNPRLLWAIIMLYRQGEDVLALWSAGKSPDLRTLFARLWQRLAADEREIIAHLAVFTHHTPRTVWPRHKKAIKQLIQRGVVAHSEQDTVGLLPILRWHIYQHELLHEERITYHHHAGDLCATLGEFTEAAVHFKKAGDTLSAFQVWYPFQQVELLRGHGLIARSLFESITPDDLDGHYVDELNALKMRLDQMQGRLRQVTMRAEKVDWSEDSEVAAEAQQIASLANRWMGNSDKAIKQLDDALTIYSRIGQKTSFILYQKGAVAMRQGDVTTAQNILLSIECEAARLRGLIDLIQGDFVSAQAHCENALSIAIKLNDEDKQVAICTLLSSLFGYQGKIEKAVEMAEKNVAYYNRTHEVVRAEMMKAEIVGMYLQIGQFERVIEQGEVSLQAIKRLGHTQIESKLCLHLAEAYYECDDLDKAKTYTQRVLQIEEVTDLPYATYTLGLICKQEGNTPLAIKTFEQGINMAIQLNDQFIEAYLQRELAKVHQIAQENDAADQSDQCLLRAVHLFEKMGLEQERQTTQAILDGKSADHPTNLDATQSA